MAGLSLQSLQKTYGKVDVIKGVNLEIAPGEFLVFEWRIRCNMGEHRTDWEIFTYSGSTREYFTCPSEKLLSMEATPAT